MLTDSQLITPRRSQLKQTVQSPGDRNTPNTHIPAKAPITVDIKKTINIRDSGFLDDEGLSGRDSELPSSRAINNKQNEMVSENAPTPNDLISRKLKSNKKKTAQKFSSFFFLFL
jgi:hypothetical protein